MPKLALPFTMLSAAGIGLLSVPAGAAMLGPHAAQCRGGTPAMLVHVIGLKDRSGTLRVQSYGGDPATFLDKGTYLERIDVPLPAEGKVEVCVPVPASGTYAISVRHMTAGTSDMDDGGGLSGNPKRTLIDLMFKRKPDPQEIALKVAGVVSVPVVMNYVQGGSFKPIRTAER